MPGSPVLASRIDGNEDADVVGEAAGGLDAAGWPVGCEYHTAAARSVTTSTARRATRRSVGTS